MPFPDLRYTICRSHKEQQNTLTTPQAAGANGARPKLRPVIGPRLRRLLAVVFTLFGLLAVNSLYLSSVTIAEALSGKLYQDYFYQLMFLLHLVLGLIIVMPAVIFGALHLRNAWPRPNYRSTPACCCC